MACHPRRRSIVCVVQKAVMLATPNIVRPCVLSKGGDIMPRPTSSDRVCCPRAMMHATPDIADHVCCPREVMSCHARRCRLCVLSKGGDVMPGLTSFNCVCCTKAMNACHARCRLTVCAAQRAMKACHARRRLSVCAVQRR